MIACRLVEHIVQRRHRDVLRDCVKKQSGNKGLQKLLKKPSGFDAPVIIFAIFVIRRLSGIPRRRKAIFVYIREAISFTPAVCRRPGVLKFDILISTIVVS